MNSLVMSGLRKKGTCDYKEISVIMEWFCNLILVLVYPVQPCQYMINDTELYTHFIPMLISWC